MNISFQIYKEKLMWNSYGDNSRLNPLTQVLINGNEVLYTWKKCGKIHHSIPLHSPDSEESKNGKNKKIKNDF